MLSRILAQPLDREDRAPDRASIHRHVGGVGRDRDRAEGRRAGPDDGPDNRGAGRDGHGEPRRVGTRDFGDTRRQALTLRVFVAGLASMRNLEHDRVLARLRRLLIIFTSASARIVTGVVGQANMLLILMIFTGKKR